MKRALLIALALLGLAVVPDVRLLADEPAAPDLPAREERAFKAAVERAAASVVRIETVGGLERIGELLVSTAPTTGVIVSEDGYIVSSAFNFAQKPDSILITLPGGKRAPARLIATDHSRAIVLLKVTVEGKLTVPEAVGAAEIRPGRWSIAIGRTFHASQPNVSVGIVSAVNRIWGKAVQTDAKISPANYGGPLVDLQGRVIGILAPLSQEVTSDIAGVDWYDSGIGFAVPLADILEVLPRLKKGEDLKPGILGISLAPGNMFVDPPAIAACRYKSPAAKAGLEAGDTIVEIAGQPVVRQSQLRHQLNSRYAGDKIKLTVSRKGQRIEREVELVAELEPYEHPFIGFLPERLAAGQAPGLIVRFVYPDSPAAKAGLKAGDRITAAAGKPVASAAELARLLSGLGPGDELALERTRGGSKEKFKVRLAQMPSEIPAALPPAHRDAPAAPTPQPQTGIIKIKIADFENECAGSVPASYNANLKYGLVVLLEPPGQFSAEDVAKRWQADADARDVILLVPKAADATRWRLDEARFVRRVMDEAIKTYNVDPSRIAVVGREAGGALAYLVGFSQRDRVRAVAAIDAELPPLITPPENDPVERLMFFLMAGSKTEPAQKAALAKLRALKYPATDGHLGATGFGAAEQQTLLRWIDTLDRL